jgi:hypothetical protein
VTALDLDLDAPTPPPTGTTRPRRWAAVGVVVVGLVGGGVIAAWAGPAPPALGPEVVARVELAGLDLSPHAEARLTVTVRNTGGTTARVGPLWPRGGGLTETPVTLTDDGRVPVLRPGEVRVLTGSAALRCDPADFSGASSSRAGTSALTTRALTARLEVVSGETMVRAVSVVSGPLSLTGAACAAARLSLPRGWGASAAPGSATVSGESLELTLPRLYGPTRFLVALRADDWFLDTATLGQDVSAGPVHLRAERPAPSCRELARRPRVASGLELVLVDAEGDLTIAFVPVGTVLTRWLTDAYTAACPPQEPGPSGTPEP